MIPQPLLGKAPERLTKPTCYAKMLTLLLEYQAGQHRFEYLPGVFLPPGELPLSAFRGPDVGGDAANVRMWELRSPEAAKRNHKGIPIRKHRHYFTYRGEDQNIITYRLDIPADLCRDLVDLEACRLDKQALADRGLHTEDYLDDADGQDKPGKAVRLILLQS